MVFKHLENGGAFLQASLGKMTSGQSKGSFGMNQQIFATGDLEKKI